MTRKITTQNRINKLVDVYLGGIQSISQDAGWGGDSILARWSTFKGDIPPPTGNDQADLAMIMAIEKLRGTHARFQVACLLLSKLTTKQRLALLACRYYVGTVDGATGKSMKDLGIADRVKMDLREYRYHRDKGYEHMAPNVELLLAVQRIVRSAA